MDKTNPFIFEYNPERYQKFKEEKREFRRSVTQSHCSARASMIQSHYQLPPQKQKVVQQVEKVIEKCPSPVVSKPLELSAISNKYQDQLKQYAYYRNKSSSAQSTDRLNSLSQANTSMNFNNSRILPESQCSTRFQTQPSSTSSRFDRKNYVKQQKAVVFTLSAAAQNVQEMNQRENEIAQLTKEVEQQEKEIETQMQQLDAEVDNINQQTYQLQNEEQKLGLLIDQLQTREIFSKQSVQEQIQRLNRSSALLETSLIFRDLFLKISKITEYKIIGEELENEIKLRNQLLDLQGVRELVDSNGNLNKIFTYRSEYSLLTTPPFIDFALKNCNFCSHKQKYSTNGVALDFDFLNMQTEIIQKLQKLTGIGQIPDNYYKSQILKSYKPSDNKMRLLENDVSNKRYTVRKAIVKLKNMGFMDKIRVKNPNNLSPTMENVQFILLYPVFCEHLQVISSTSKLFQPKTQQLLQTLYNQSSPHVISAISLLKRAYSSAISPFNNFSDCVAALEKFHENVVNVNNDLYVAVDNLSEKQQQLEKVKQSVQLITVLQKKKASLQEQIEQLVLEMNKTIGFYVPLKQKDNIQENELEIQALKQLNDYKYEGNIHFKGIQTKATKNLAYDKHQFQSSVHMELQILSDQQAYLELAIKNLAGSSMMSKQDALNYSVDSIMKMVEEFSNKADIFYRTQNPEIIFQARKQLQKQFLNNQAQINLEKLMSKNNKNETEQKIEIVETEPKILTQKVKTDSRHIVQKKKTQVQLSLLKILKEKKQEEDKKEYFFE
ncbi:Hypothetical_protein [Hexamita inflata]|uniref:Hypothetical_protein n=1 Tax=Hexamita inflata TaxID=28002 RepID=A0AA86Q0Q5_9EUKA|nr:Hypothetical protein HINF_LOCUS35018 [Hexamita inflata]